MPVVGLRDRIPRPVRALGVDENDARIAIPLIGIAPDIEVALGRSRRRRPRALEPRMLIGRVVEHELDDHVESALVRRMRGMS